MTVRQLLRQADARELAEWQAYARLESEDRDERLQRAELEAKAQQGLAATKQRRRRR